MRIGRITSKTIRLGETDRYNALLAKTYSVCLADFDMPIDELMTKGWDDPSLVTAAVAGIGRELVRDGAEVLICGSTTFGPLCTATGVTRLEPEGVPIIDPLAVTLKLAEVMVDFRDRIGLPFVSRGSTYRLPPEADKNRVRALFGLS